MQQVDDVEHAPYKREPARHAGVEPAENEAIEHDLRIDHRTQASGFREPPGFEAGANHRRANTARLRVPDATQRKRIHQPFHDLRAQQSRSGAPPIRTATGFERWSARALCAPGSAPHHEQRSQRMCRRNRWHMRCSCCSAPGTRPYLTSMIPSYRSAVVKMPSTVPPGAHRGPDNGPNFAGETPCIPDRDRSWAWAPDPSVRNYRYRVPASRSGGRW